MHWIVIEDSNTKTNQVSTFFAENCNVKYTHLNVGSPAYSRKLKGFAQRNEGMNWVRQHFRDSSNRKEGVLYFVDDDDTYSIIFFDEMRYTKTISVWPVGLVGGVLVKKPIVLGDKLSNSYKVTG